MFLKFGVVPAWIVVRSMLGLVPRSNTTGPEEAATTRLFDQPMVGTSRLSSATSDITFPPLVNCHLFHSVENEIIDDDDSEKYCGLA